MTNISGLLTIGPSALLTQQKVINVTGNNIANVNTPEYSRQQLTIKQGSTVYIIDQAMITGVAADTSIQRSYDQFISAQLNAKNEDLGHWEAFCGRLYLLAADHRRQRRRAGCILGGQ